MKRIIMYFSIMLSVAFYFAGCESVLDISPKNIISEEAVKNDPALVDAFLTKIYNQTRFQSGTRQGRNYAGANTERFSACLAVVGGEINVFAPWQEPWQAAVRIINENGAHGALEYWPYDNIRSANEILQILEEATFDPAMVRQKSAEARWLRAFMYFELVKRYGGVPLILEAQSIDQPMEELYIPRSPEKAIYDFIASEMDALVQILPSTYSADDFGRPTRWAAYALKSRAMLYAASIAKYGSVQLNGLLGIPQGEANAYYQKAYDAALKIINESPHLLYRQNPDPMRNYGEIFLRDRNSEIIFAEVYDVSLLKSHSWSFVSMPDAFAVAGGSNHRVYIETFERYEYNDGTPGTLDYSQLNGSVKFSLEELVLRKDPRFLASAFHPETHWQDGVVYIHSAIAGDVPPGWSARGNPRDINSTGFMVRKRVDEAVKEPLLAMDDSDWIVFRTAEMYLNAAEAAFERGETEEAKRLVNIIRDRAGMPPKSNLTVDDIRNERFVELFLEEHRYWDLRRWRTAVQELNGKGFRGVNWTYHSAENQYTMTLKPGDPGGIRTFAERNYYFPMGLARLGNNPALIENPGY